MSIKNGEIIAGIEAMVRTYYPTAPWRVYVLQRGFLALNSSGELEFVFDDSDKKLKLSELEEDRLIEIYMFLDVQKFVPETVVVPYEVKLPSWEDLPWCEIPREIKSGDGEVIGRLGLVYVEKRQTGSLVAAVFVSGDGSWATLTMYEEAIPKQRVTANEDIVIIAKEIGQLVIT